MSGILFCWHNKILLRNVLKCTRWKLAMVCVSFLYEMVRLAKEHNGIIGYLFHEVLVSMSLPAHNSTAVRIAFMILIGFCSIFYTWKYRGCTISVRKKCMLNHFVLISPRSSKNALRLLYVSKVIEYYFHRIQIFPLPSSSPIFSAFGFLSNNSNSFEK